MQDITRTPVLVLNSGFEPINITSARRALRLVLGGVAYVEEASNIIIRSGLGGLALPSVIRLISYHRIPSYSYTLSRKNVLLRDRYTCQYCQRVFPSSDLTLDHVTPRCDGGRSSWENLVACCRSCNHKKGGRTPEQAGMRLITKPRSAGSHTNRLMLRAAGGDNDMWRKYLYY